MRCFLKKEYIEYARSKMIEFKLYGWSLSFNNGKKRLGVTKFPKREISISKYVLDSDDESVFREVFLHELAHAIDFERNGLRGGLQHDRVWSEICVSLGLIPKRTLPNNWIEKLGIKLNYTLSCNYCGYENQKDRISFRKRYLCPCCLEERGAEIDLLINKNKP